jgi:hypothetical protein
MSRDNKSKETTLGIHYIEDTIVYYSNAIRVSNVTIENIQGSFEEKKNRLYPIRLYLGIRRFCKNKNCFEEPIFSEPILIKNFNYSEHQLKWDIFSLYNEEKETVGKLEVSESTSFKYCAKLEGFEFKDVEVDSKIKVLLESEVDGKIQKIEHLLFHKKK